jgi:hypothetical protein
VQTTSAVVILALVLVGCAHRSPDQLGPLQPVVDPYSRNGIVCLPTGLGNLIGGVPGQLALAPFTFVDMEKHQTIERIASYLMVVLSIAPAFVAGGALGTPFLPFSYLADEEPCHWI